DGGLTGEREFIQRIAVPRNNVSRISDADKGQAEQKAKQELHGTFHVTQMLRAMLGNIKAGLGSRTIAERQAFAHG
ncbi:MAG TPA: hypothetical protein VLZ12_04180, partial [Verrucomicrobiae bacterium]|nr:hypothetical protein [Verrucomicrobiae bacterium]